MNAVSIRRSDSRDYYPVPYVGDDEMDESFSELRADVRNLQVHVTDIKAEVRATNSRLDSLRDKIEQYRAEDNKRVDERFGKIDDRFQKVDDRFEEARKETKADFAVVRGEIGILRAEMKDDFREVRTDLGKLGARLDAATRWALRLYIGSMVILLGIMAHGFKWI